MDRRQFLQHGLAATAAAGVGVGVGMPATAATPAKLPKPTLQALAGNALQGHTRLCAFHEDGTEWTVYEDLRTSEGAISFVCSGGMLTLGKRTEAAFPSDKPPYFGMKLAEAPVPQRLGKRIVAMGKVAALGVLTRLGKAFMSDAKRFHYQQRRHWNLGILQGRQA